MLDGATARVSLKGALAGVRVLVVDDDEDVRDVLRLTLEHLGAEVRTAASANEALAAIDSALPDVLLSDLAMP
ncbi:MAG: response regulator, partial [Polyangia bacterium]